MRQKKELTRQFFSFNVSLPLLALANFSHFPNPMSHCHFCTEGVFTLVYLINKVDYISQKRISSFSYNNIKF
jgi:hypothetical protein